MMTDDAPTSLFRIISPRYSSPPLRFDSEGSVTMLPPLQIVRKLSRSPRYAPIGSPDHDGGKPHALSLPKLSSTPEYSGASHNRPYVSLVAARTTGRPPFALTSRLHVSPVADDLSPKLSASAAMSAGRLRRYPAGAFRVRASCPKDQCVKSADPFGLTNSRPLSPG